MKWLFISDIHGRKTNLPKIQEKMASLQCDKLIVLGDLYYMGPRNEIEEDYDISYVRDFLESYKDKLICMRGNCDSDVDIEISNFPIMNDLSMISFNNLDLYLTHGNIYNENNWEKENSILIYGHYHVPFIREKNGMIFINPGSISLPRENNNPSYLVFDGKEFIIYDIYDNVIAHKTLTNNN